MAEQRGILHNPEHLRALATQLREEAKRAEAQAEKIEKGTPEVMSSGPGCWNIIGTCIWVQFL